MNDNTSPVKDMNTKRYSLIPCYFGAHRYVVYKDEPINSLGGTIIARNIITMCSVCGKIKSNYIKLINANELI